jgi:hypothetical protein
MELIINDDPSKTYQSSNSTSNIYTFNVDNINVTGDFTLELKNITVPPGSGNADTAIVIDNLKWNSYLGPTLDSEAIEKSVITVFPNPFHENLKVYLGDFNTCTINFINALGQNVYTYKINNRDTAVLNPSFEKVPPGIYTIVISNDENYKTIRSIRK